MHPLYLLSLALLSLSLQSPQGTHGVAKVLLSVSATNTEDAMHPQGGSLKIDVLEDDEEDDDFMDDTPAFTEGSKMKLSIPKAGDPRLKAPDPSLLENIPGVKKETITFDPNKIARSFETDEDPSPLIKLRTPDFERYIKKNKAVMAFFYKFDCEACDAMYSHFKNGASSVEGLSLDVKFVVVNCDTDPAIANKYEFHNYPEVYLFQNGSVNFPTHYEHKSATGSFAEWAIKLEFPLRELEEKDYSVTTLKSHLNMGCIGIVGFVIKGSKKEHFMRKLAADSYDELTQHFVLVYITDRSKVRVEIHRKPQRFMLADDNDVSTYVGDEDHIWYEDDVSELADQAYLRSIHQDFDENLHTFLDSKLLLISPGGSRQYYDIARSLETLAFDYDTKLNFTFILPENHGVISTKIGIPDFEDSVFIVECDEVSGQVWDKKGPVKYKFTGDIQSESELRSFIQDWEKGLLVPYKKNLSFKPVDPLMMHLTAETFEFTALNPDFVTFVLYYYKRCIACDKALPKWRQLYDAVQKSKFLKERVIVAVMNAGANELLDEDIQEFPDFVLYPAGENIMQNKKRYAGRLRKELLIDFIESAIEEQTEREEL